MDGPGAGLTGFVNIVSSTVFSNCNNDNPGLRKEAENMSNNMFNHSLEIYPNPYDNYFNLSFDTKIEEDILIVIYNNDGIEIYNQMNFSKKGLNTFKIDSQIFPSGFYIVKLISNSNIRACKAVKK